MLGRQEKQPNWDFIKTDLTDENQLNKIFKSFQPDTVVNLATQAGVRYSLKNPKAYINSNIVGFMNVLDLLLYLTNRYQ